MTNETPVKQVAEMNAGELEYHIKRKDETHKREMKHLRALLRVLEDRDET